MKLSVLQPRRRRAAYQATFEGVEGQAVLADLIHHTGFANTIIHPDATVMAYRAGAHDVVRRILKIIHKKPEDVIRWLEREEGYDVLTGADPDSVA